MTWLWTDFPNDFLLAVRGPENDSSVLCIFQGTLLFCRSVSAFPPKMGNGKRVGPSRAARGVAKLPDPDGGLGLAEGAGGGGELGLAALAVVLDHYQALAVECLPFTGLEAFK